jgi:hypothetical protein
MNLDDKTLREAIRRNVAHAEPKKDLIGRIEELEEKLLSATIDGYDMAKHEYRDRIKELEAKLAELLAVAKRAVRLSLDHSDFKLYAMEPMHQAIAAAELKGQNDE